MAFDIFSIPVISNKVKCVFLAAKRLIIDKRNCLGVEVIKASKCYAVRYLVPTSTGNWARYVGK